MKIFFALTVLLFAFVACGENRDNGEEIQTIFEIEIGEEYEQIENTFYEEEILEREPPNRIYYTNEHFENFEQLANAATDILRVMPLEQRGRNHAPGFINLMVITRYKGDFSHRDIIEIYYPYPPHGGYEEIYMYSFLLFLRTCEDGTVLLLNPNQSVYEWDWRANAHDESRTSYFYSNIHEQFELYFENLPETRREQFEFFMENAPIYQFFTVDYNDLTAVWDNHLIEMMEAHTPLEFNAIVVSNPSSVDLRHLLPAYPIALTSVEDISEYFEFYRNSEMYYYSTWPDSHRQALTIPQNRYIENFSFDNYDEEFFSGNFIVLFHIVGSSISFSNYRVDAFLENGNIYLTRLIPNSEDFAVVSYHIILEVSNEIIPEHLNLIFNERRAPRR
jgi:hypothetical protein